MERKLCFIQSKMVNNSTYIWSVTLYRYECGTTIDIRIDGDIKRDSNRTSGCSISSYILNVAETRRSRNRSLGLQETRPDHNFLRRDLPSFFRVIQIRVSGGFSVARSHSRVHGWCSHCNWTPTAQRFAWYH